MAGLELSNAGASLIKKEPPESTDDAFDIPLDLQAENIPNDR